MAIYYGGRKVHLILGGTKVTFIVPVTVKMVVTVSPGDVILNQGQVQQFSASVDTSDESVSQDITWSVIGSDKSTISDSGLLTVSDDEVPGTSFKVRATAVYNGSFGESTVLITAEPWLTVAIAPAEIRLDRGTAQQFAASIEASDETIPKNVTWSLIGTEKSSISQTGLLTVHKDDAGKVFTVRVMASYNSVYADAVIMVNVFTPTISISVTPQSIIMDRKTSQQFSASVETNDDEISKAVVWSLVGANDSTISQSGLVYLSENEAVGAKIAIRATAVYNGTYAESVITVSAAEVKPELAIAINPTSASVVRKGTQQFTASVTTLSPSTPKTVTWSLTGNTHNNTNISANGLLTVHNAESVGGVLTVRVTANYDGSYAEARVTVL